MKQPRTSIALVAVPVGVALLFGMLLLPRRATPPHEGIPLPIASPRAVEHAEQVDRERAASVQRDALAGPVRALGSAIREYHRLEKTGDPRALGLARTAVDGALTDAALTGDGELLRLRAVQLEGFLAEIARFEATGAESAELESLAGGFVRSMRMAGWCEGRALVPRETVLRVLFKHMWDAFLGFDGRPGFDPSLDEERALYAFYLSHPHPSPSMREALAAARRGIPADSPPSSPACQGLAEAERGAIEAWRIERIARLASIDPSYPAAYARGIANFERADFGAAAQAFRAWSNDHPEGPLALRAANFLRASAAAERAESH